MIEEGCNFPKKNIPTSTLGCPLTRFRKRVTGKLIVKGTGEGGYCRCGLVVLVQGCQITTHDAPDVLPTIDLAVNITPPFRFFRSISDQNVLNRFYWNP